LGVATNRLARRTGFARTTEGLIESACGDGPTDHTNRGYGVTPSPPVMDTLTIIVATLLWSRPPRGTLGKDLYELYPMRIPFTITTNSSYWVASGIRRFLDDPVLLIVECLRSLA